MKNLYGMDFTDSDYVKSTLMLMAFFLAIYVFLYNILKKKIGISPEYTCRIVTFMHGVTSCFIALYYVVLPAVGFTQKVDSIPFQIILTHSMGYFTFDLFWCMLNGETVVMLFHHVLTVVGLFYYSFKLSRQFFIVYALGLTEITNPFLQIRWFLKHHGMRESLLFKIIEVKLIILFFVIRVVVLSYYLYEAFFNKELDFNVDDLSFISLGVLTGYALSFQMFNYVIHQLKKSQKNKPIKKE